jgi:hypothetical protein
MAFRHVLYDNLEKYTKAGRPDFVFAHSMDVMSAGMGRAGTEEIWTPRP